MQHTLKTLALGLAYTALQAQAGASLGPGTPPSSFSKALYTISNLSPNMVIALPVDDNGVVYTGTSTPTGGDGGAFLQEDGVTPVPVDSLGSQDAVVVSGNYVYVVNAGSNTISALSIDPFDPTTLSLVDVPTALEGDFPISIAASAKLGTLCVATAGVKNGIECFETQEGFLKADGQGLRSFGLSAQNPPLMKAASVGDIFFGIDDSFLFATVKGGPGAPTGFVNTYPVHSGTVSTTAVQTVSNMTAVPFGGFDFPFSAEHVFVAEAAFGAVSYLVNTTTGTAYIAGKGVASPAVKAICWSEYSSYTATAWATSPISNTLVQFGVDKATFLSENTVANANGGFLDFVVPNRYLYSLAAGSQNGTKALIVAVDLGSNGDAPAPSTVQQLTIGFGADNYAHGLAYWGAGWA